MFPASHLIVISIWLVGLVSSPPSPLQILERESPNLENIGTASGSICSMLSCGVLWIICRYNRGKNHQPHHTWTTNYNSIIYVHHWLNIHFEASKQRIKVTPHGEIDALLQCILIFAEQIPSEFFHCLTIMSFSKRGDCTLKKSPELSGEKSIPSIAPVLGSHGSLRHPGFRIRGFLDPIIWIYPPTE